MTKIEYKSGVIVEKEEEAGDIIEIDRSRMGTVRGNADFRFEGNELAVLERTRGIFEDKSFFLDDDYDWILCRDNTDELCLIPLRKEREVIR